jgi:hypothetical protein
MMYRITEDPMYRDWGWKIFQSFQKYGLVEDGEGYTSLDDVRTVPPMRRDNMESFWLVSDPHVGSMDLGSSQSNFVFTGRDVEVSVFAVLTTRLPSIITGRFQHRGAHFPSLELHRLEVQDWMEAEIRSWKRSAP